MKGHLSEKICDTSPAYRRHLEETITGCLHVTLQQQKRWTVRNASPGITGATRNPASGRPRFMERIGMDTLKSDLLQFLPYIPLEKVT